MGFFQWLGQLLDDLVEWLGRAFTVFIEELILALKNIWELAVETALLAAFGAVSVLYVIFYAAASSAKTIMEVWDPNYFDSKPSEIFVVDKAPQDSPLPTHRNKAKILKLKQ